MEKDAVLGFLRPLGCRADLKFYEIADSTNLRALEIFKSGGMKAPFAVVAARQSAGRGRFGRVWRDADGKSICLTCGFDLAGVSHVAAEKYSILAGCFIARALAGRAGADIKIKWPNDLYCGGKKLGGMIGECVAAGGRLAFMYFGVGVNFGKIEDFEGGNPAGIEEIAAKKIGINETCAIVINSAVEAFETLKKNPGLDISAEFSKFDFLRGKTIAVDNFSEIKTGVASGVNSRGELLLRLESGLEISCGAGEATIKKDSF
ncbi:MAG: biotin--[acetyl-CoA-carboxylase] ligase [Opitutales bacterium]|nr:biotin--[acetyl-CoA-carboxylase] ligase [Opitutales bacterium]